MKKFKLYIVVVLTMWSMLTAFRLPQMLLSNHEEATFQEFLKAFPEGKLPFALSVETLREHLEAHRSKDKKSPLQKKRLNSTFTDFLISEQEREFTRSPLTVDALMTTKYENKHLIIYAVGRGLRGHLDFFAGLYDAKGLLLKRELFASSNTSEFIEGSINKNLQIKTTTYDIFWSQEKDRRQRKIKAIIKEKTEVKSLLDNE